MRNCKIEQFENRIIFFDIAKIIATCFVILLHTSEYKYHWNDCIFNCFCHIISLWAVPLFVMVSGGLFLNKDISIKKLYSKYILRILFALIFWSFVYFIIYANDVFISASFHLWYLYMITFLYMVTPFLKEIIKNNSVMIYFLILSFVVNFIFSFNQNIYFEDNTYLSVVKGFAFFYVFGFYMKKKSLGKNVTNLIYILGLMAFILYFVYLYFVYIYNKTSIIIPRETYNYFNIFILCETLFVFVLLKNICQKIVFNEKSKKIIYLLSKYSFGVYCVHKVFIYNIFNENVFLKTIIVIVLSFGTSALLNNIPFIKKYFV